MTRPYLNIRTCFYSNRQAFNGLTKHSESILEWHGKLILLEIQRLLPLCSLNLAMKLSYWTELAPLWIKFCKRISTLSSFGKGSELDLKCQSYWPILLWTTDIILHGRSNINLENLDIGFLFLSIVRLICLKLMLDFVLMFLRNRSFSLRSRVLNIQKFWVSLEMTSHLNMQTIPTLTLKN